MALRLLRTLKGYQPNYWRLVAFRCDRTNGTWRLQAWINLYKDRESAERLENALETCEVVMHDHITTAIIEAAVVMVYNAVKIGVDACYSSIDMTQAEDILEPGQEPAP